MSVWIIVNSAYHNSPLFSWGYFESSEAAQRECDKFNKDAVDAYEDRNVRMSRFEGSTTLTLKQYVGLTGKDWFVPAEIKKGLDET